MTELLPDWIAELAPLEQRLLIAAIIAGGLLALAMLLHKPLLRWREQRRFLLAVKRLGARVLRNVTLPDGLGGTIGIDFLVLRRNGILVVGVKRYDGMIFGGANTDEWTQTLNSRSYRFPNPDAHLARQVGAVRNLAPKIPVRGLHLFTDSAEFPWDKPPNVLQSQDVLDSDASRPAMKDIPAELRAAWTELRRAAKR